MKRTAMSYFSGKPHARKFVWEQFPPEGRFPRFAGEERASARLFETAPLKSAQAIKVDRARVLRWVRTIALARGITVYVASQNLARGFLRLDPQTRRASRVAHDQLPPLDAIVVASVVVTRDGYNCARGSGDADLEYAILREHGHPAVPVLTIVDPAQIVRYFPAYEHDPALSFIATPDELIAIDRPPPPPTRIYRTHLPDERRTLLSLVPPRIEMPAPEEEEDEDEDEDM